MLPFFSSTTSKSVSDSCKGKVLAQASHKSPSSSSPLSKVILSKKDLESMATLVSVIKTEPEATKPYPLSLSLTSPENGDTKPDDTKKWMLREAEGNNKVTLHLSSSVNLNPNLLTQWLVCN